MTKKVDAGFNAVNALIATYEAWLANPAQAPIRAIEGDAEELILHVSEMCLSTQEGDEERALRGATKQQAEVWRAWLNAFIALWEATANPDRAPPQPQRRIRIETSDTLGNVAYFFKNARGWVYASSSGIPLATSNWAHGKAMALQFALADAKTPEAALRAVKDHYHSGPALARARLV